MSALITINTTQIEQLIYKDEPVVTFEMIARVHGVSVKNVQKSFDRHQARFTEGKHVYRIDYTEANKLLPGVEVSRNGLRLFTRHGYLLLVKPMKDEHSWQVQEEMIDEYFAMRQALQEATYILPAVDPLANYPELRAIQELIIATAEARNEATAARQEAAVARWEAREAKDEAAMAKNNTDIILDRYRMTLEQFVGSHGLLSVIPPSSFRAASRWLSDYCRQQNWDAPSLPVEGRPWPTEKSYPVEALMRYVEYLRKRPQQIALVPQPMNGGAV